MVKGGTVLVLPKLRYLVTLPSVFYLRRRQENSIKTYFLLFQICHHCHHHHPASPKQIRLLLAQTTEKERLHHCYSSHMPSSSSKAESDPYKLVHDEMAVLCSNIRNVSFCLHVRLFCKFIIQIMHVVSLLTPIIC